MYVNIVVVVVQDKLFSDLQSKDSRRFRYKLTLGLSYDFPGLCSRSALVTARKKLLFLIILSSGHPRLLGWEPFLLFKFFS